MRTAGPIAAAQLFSSQNDESEREVGVAGIVHNRAGHGAHVVLERVGIEDRCVAQCQIEKDDDRLGGAGAEVFRVQHPGMCAHFPVNAIHWLPVIRVSTDELAGVDIWSVADALSVEWRCKSDAQSRKGEQSGKHSDTLETGQDASQ